MNSVGIGKCRTIAGNHDIFAEESLARGLIAWDGDTAVFRVPIESEAIPLSIDGREIVEIDELG